MKGNGNNILQSCVVLDLVNNFCDVFSTSSVDRQTNICNKDTLTSAIKAILKDGQIKMCSNLSESIKSTTTTNLNPQ